MLLPYKASIAICTYNRLRLLKLCIDSLSKLDSNPKDFEIIVIDNNSKDETEKFCKLIPGLYPQLNFRYVLEQRQGVGFTRTRGAEESQGAVVAYIDDDCLAESNWLNEIINFYETHPKAMSTGGCIIPKYLTPVAPWFGKYFWGLVGNYDLGKVVFQMNGARYPSGANMHFRKEAFDKYGYFDGTLGRSGTGLVAGEEKAMYLKLLKGNEQIYYLPQVIVHHHVEGNKFDKGYVRRHSMGVGTSERLMNKNSTLKLILKFLEYVGKLGYAFAYGLGYVIKGESSKMFMLVKSRLWVLEGFLWPQRSRRS